MGGAGSDYQVIAHISCNSQEQLNEGYVKESEKVDCIRAKNVELWMVYNSTGAGFV